MLCSEVMQKLASNSQPPRLLYCSSKQDRQILSSVEISRQHHKQRQSISNTHGAPMQRIKSQKSFYRVLLTPPKSFVRAPLQLLDSSYNLLPNSHLQHTYFAQQLGF